MSKFLTVAIFLLALTPLYVTAHEKEGPGTTVIHMTPNGFEPKEVTIEQGDIVIFENRDTKGRWPASNIHPTHRLYPDTDLEKCGRESETIPFDACDVIPPDESYSFSFIHDGEWRLHDHLSPNFKGTIIVLALESYSSDDEPSILNRLWSTIKNFFRIVLFQDRSNDSFASLSGAFKEEVEEFDKNYDPTISKSSQEIFTDKGSLFSYVKKFGANDTIKQLHNLEYNYGFAFCHNNAHDVGRFSYALEGGEAFQKCSSECHSGCYHGATEAYFRDRGLANLIEDLALLCDDSLNTFFSHQCIHGIGHGLMAWADYDIHSALKNCDQLPQGRASCHSGVFMENIVGGLAADSGHFTEYLSLDPHMPCNVVDEKYAGACYFYQTSRMVQIFSGDFSKVAAACSEIDPKYHRQCFSSMGRDVGGRNPTNNQNAITACSYAPEGSNRIACLSGAVQNTFWVAQGQDRALSFCALLSDSVEKDACYITVFSRATQVIEAGDFQNFCGNAEKDYISQCLGYF